MMLLIPRTLTRVVGLLVGFAAALSLVSITGCGPSGKPTVEGVVKYKGTALTGGILFVKSGSDEPKSTVISPSGSYKILDPPTGSCKVWVVALPRPESKDEPPPPKLPAGFRHTSETSSITVTFSGPEKNKEINFP